MVTSSTNVIVIGAGPYGLSIAAHLSAAGVDFRIFGKPMETWCSQMPDGMLLKSDGFASNLSDPGADFTLQKFCEASQVPYHDTNIPVTLETFRAYGLAFQRHVVPQLEDTFVEHVDANGAGFRVRTAAGETISARQVVVAVGISHFAYVPPVLAGLPSPFASHSFGHADLSGFRGKRITVVGAGASAIDMAVLLKEAGADATLVARRPALRFNDPPPEALSFSDRLRSPQSMIGPGWKSRLYTDAPWVFRYLPANQRIRIVLSHNGPAAGWPMKERFVGKVEALLGCEIQAARIIGDAVCLTLIGPHGTTEHLADHVIAATGYRADLRRLVFLDSALRDRIRTVGPSPALAADFESSVRGLYFVGAASANTFGPVMRFACGADWTARRIMSAFKKAPSYEVGRVAVSTPNTVA
jgi:cation diffusion facilitator CzcD-associated flavoprotein CzcO